MIKTTFVLSCILSAFLSSAFGSTTPDAASILKKAESIRNPRVSYEGKIKVTDERKSKQDVRTYRVRARSNEKSRVDYLTPESDAGTSVVMSDNDMWIKLPKSANPIRVAPKQKLVGNAAYGDIASLSFDDNYTATYKTEESFDGKKSIVLDLKAMPDRAVTYERIEYWVEKSSNKPLKALYMTDSGKVLREGVFTGYQAVLGVDRPMKLVLKDRLDQNLTTTIEFMEAKEKKFPDSIFQKSSLK